MTDDKLARLKRNIRVVMDDKLEKIEMSRYERMEAAEELAKSRGLTIVLPRENQAQIDIDNGQDFAWFCQAIAKLRTLVPCTYDVGDSPSGKTDHYHITVTFNRALTHAERIAVQAALGSDRMRELLGFIRYMNGEPNPSLFFEKDPQP